MLSQVEPTCWPAQSWFSISFWALRCTSAARLCCFLLAPAIDLVLLAPYLRFVKRRPALLTFGTLTITAVLLALAPFAIQGAGLALWVLFPLVAAGAGFVLGRRKFLWQMAGITTIIVAAAAFQLIRTGEQVTLDLRALGVLAVVTVASIWLTAWIEGRSLQPEANEREILGEPLTVVRGVMIVPFHWAVGGIQTDALRLELGDLKRVHSPRWVVLDLGPAGEVGRRDLSAVERAVEFDHALTLYDRTGATAGRRHRAPGHRATRGRSGRTLRYRAAGGRGRLAAARLGDQHGAGAAGGDDDLAQVWYNSPRRRRDSHYPKVTRPDRQRKSEVGRHATPLQCCRTVQARHSLHAARRGTRAAGATSCAAGDASRCHAERDAMADNDAANHAHARIAVDGDPCRQTHPALGFRVPGSYRPVPNLRSDG